MTHITSIQQVKGGERPLLLASHPFCRLINAHCDQPITYNCGEQKDKRPMFPAKVCPHAHAALLLQITSQEHSDVTKIAGRGDTATLFVVNGKQIASITRGNMTIYDKPVIN